MRKTDRFTYSSKKPFDFGVTEKLFIAIDSFFATEMKTRRCPGHIVFRFNHVYSLQQLKWFPEKPRWLQINSSDIPSHTSKGQSDLKQNVAKEVATTHIVPAQLWEEVAPSHQAECPKQSLTYCFW